MNSIRKSSTNEPNTVAEGILPSDAPESQAAGRPKRNAAVPARAHQEGQCAP